LILKWKVSIISCSVSLLISSITIFPIYFSNQILPKETLSKDFIIYYLLSFLPVKSVGHFRRLFDISCCIPFLQKLICFHIYESAMFFFFLWDLVSYMQWILCCYRVWQIQRDSSQTKDKKAVKEKRSKEKKKLRKSKDQIQYKE
jgi:hypothetical protein